MMQRTKRFVPSNKTIWTDDMISFLIDNHQKLTNAQLACQLKLGLTVLRNKKYELGLNQFKMIYWTKGQTQLLVNLYQNTGDVEIAEILNKESASDKFFTKKHIMKKRRLLKLFRTEQMVEAIKAKNVKDGRHSYLHYHKSGTGLSDAYVKGILTRQTGIKNIDQFPELIEVKRLSMKLNRLTR